MARLPVKQLRKKDLEWLGTNYCRHGHTYLTHYNCFLEEKPDTAPFSERIGFLDIESSNLSADFGYCFSYALKELDGDLIGRVLKPSEIRRFIFDKNLMNELCNDIKHFHRIVVHYGTDYRFDLPFLRTRCVLYGLDFPLYKEVYAEDTFSAAKSKFRFSRNRLESICEFFEIPAKEHKMRPQMWQRALAGDKESLEWIWNHNIEDVYSLEAVWLKMNPYVNRAKRSI